VTVTLRPVYPLPVRVPGFFKRAKWELEYPSPSFDAALKALTDGIEQCDTAMLGFLGVYLD
jgi:hypothetical protein